MESNTQHIFQVSELSLQVRQLLEASYPAIWVEGEISNLARPASGHLYFSIKDEKSQIRCAFFRNRMSRLDCKPENGLKVRIKAQVSLYENRGDFQLIVSQLEEAGIGDLQARFERLKRTLAAEGLFSNQHKQPIPKFPGTIGVITSATGAAIKDIISTCERRYPIVRLLVYPVQVQGEHAAKQITATLQTADRSDACDVLIIGRGGGSLEDLWAFNDEHLARAIFNCKTPVISAVGHEIDFTISDFVADMRAPTPTAAAELACPDAEQLEAQFNRTEKRLSALIKNILINKIQRVDMLTRRIIHPAIRLKSQIQLNTQCAQRLKLCITNQLNTHHQHHHHLLRLLRLNTPENRIKRFQQQLKQHRQQLDRLIKARLSIDLAKLDSARETLVAISPQSTLERGYAIVSDAASQHILRSVKQASGSDEIQIQLADGSFKAKTLKQN